MKASSAPVLDICSNRQPPSESRVAASSAGPSARRVPVARKKGAAAVRATGEIAGFDCIALSFRCPVFFEGGVDGARNLVDVALRLRPVRVVKADVRIDAA